MRAIKLPKKCDRAAAESLHPDILEAFGDISIAVDAGEVEHIGQAMLQLLCSAAGSAGGIHLTACSDAFCNTVELARLENVLSAGEPS